jgi:hypothetical protein
MFGRRGFAVTGALVLVTAALAFFVPWMGALCLALVALAILGLIIAAGVLALFRLAKVCGLSQRPAPWKPVWVCLAIGLMGVAGLIVTNVWIPSPLPPSPLAASDELTYLLRTDQEDRIGIRLRGFMERDQQRLDRVLDLHQSGVVVTPRDCFAAALILQHGSESVHYELAHQLAKTARDGGVQGADWLAKATYDRWMISIGQPQEYGTQTTVSLGAVKE